MYHNPVTAITVERRFRGTGESPNVSPVPRVDAGWNCITVYIFCSAMFTIASAPLVRVYEIQ